MKIKKIKDENKDENEENQNQNKQEMFLCPPVIEISLW